MDICIRLEKIDRSPWPKWDDTQHDNDIEFGDMIWDLPHHVAESNEDLIRPLSFDGWRDAILARRWPNERRYLQLLEILAAEPSYWILVIH